LIIILNIYTDQNSAEIVKRLAKDKEWNVEAARILLDWTHKEEYDKIIFKDIGIDCIFGLLKVEPKLEITPLIVESLNHLLQKG
jgi:transaldolase